MTDTPGPVMVELIGGPYDGHRQGLMTRAEATGPREALGTWMIVPGPWPDDTPTGCVARAEYTPDPAPAPADRWHYRGWIYT